MNKDILTKDITFEINMLNGTTKINDIVVSSGSPSWYN